MTKAIQTGEYVIETIVTALKELLQSSPTSPKLKAIVKKLKIKLNLYFANHDENYLAEVLQLFPNWHRKVQYLEDHCRDLLDDIHVIHDMLTNAEKEANDRLSIWLISFDKYRRKEGSLIMDAYLLDLGCE